MQSFKLIDEGWVGLCDPQNSQFGQIPDDDVPINVKCELK